MAQSGRSPACVFHRALPQRPLEALLYKGALRIAHARRDQGGQGLGRTRRPDFFRPYSGRSESCRAKSGARRSDAPRRMKFAPIILVAALGLVSLGLGTIGPAAAA